MPTLSSGAVMPARPRARPFRRPAVLRARGKTPPRPPRLWAGQATPMRRKCPATAGAGAAPRDRLFRPAVLKCSNRPESIPPPLYKPVKGYPPYFPLMCEIDRGQIKHLSTAPISFQLPKNQSYAPTHQKSELSPSTRLAEKESYAQLTKNTSSDRPAPRGL